MRLLLALCVLAAPASAQDWVTRDGDSRFTAQELDDRLRGQVITFFDDGQSRFFDDDRYTYSYAGPGGIGTGGTAYGYFTVNADSTVCIEFVNGFSRCDLYVENGGRLVLVTEEGERFPVRLE